MTPHLMNKRDAHASPDELFQDVGLWLSQKIKVKTLLSFALPYY